MSRLPSIAASLLFMTSTCFAGPIAMAKSSHKPAPLICPVTGEKIVSVKDAAGSSVYKGKTYYFCCASCKPMFDANPAKYVKTAAAH